MLKSEFENKKLPVHEKHCGVCVYFNSEKYGVYWCSAKHTEEEMFNQIDFERGLKDCDDFDDKFKK